MSRHNTGGRPSIARMRCDAIWRNARLATLTAGAPGLGEIDRGMVAQSQGRIVYAGAADRAPALEAERDIDCAGRWITPGLIDCHTHLVFGGNRSAEFERRLAGATYEEIAREGGGILSTVRATRAASVAALVEGALPRLDALIADGVTTVEIKSGYGLSLEAESRQLQAARVLGDRRDVAVRTTLLAAPALPPEFAGHPDGYGDTVSRDRIPAVARARQASEWHTLRCGSW